MTPPSTTSLPAQPLSSPGPPLSGPGGLSLAGRTVDAASPTFQAGAGYLPLRHGAPANLHGVVEGDYAKHARAKIRSGDANMNERFRKFAFSIAEIVGTPWAFLAALGTVGLVMVNPAFGIDDSKRLGGRHGHRALDGGQRGIRGFGHRNRLRRLRGRGCSGAESFCSALYSALSRIPIARAILPRRRRLMWMSGCGSTFQTS